MNGFQLRGSVEEVASYKQPGRYCLWCAAALLAGVVVLTLPLNAQTSGGAGSVDGRYYNQLLDSPFQEGPEVEVTPEVAYRMRIDPRMKVSRPRLTRFPNAAVIARINLDLEDDFSRNRSWAAALSGRDSSANVRGFYDEKVTVNFFLPDILSVLVETQWFSGGAHPNEGGYSINYDLHTGKRFDLGEAFQTSPGNEAETAAALAKLYLQHYVKPSAKDAPPDTDCEEIVRGHMSRKDVPFSPLLYLSKEGLVIEPPLPHVVSACGPAITVPYGELRPYLKKDSVLRSLVEAPTQNK